MSGLKASKQQQSNFKRPDPLDTGSYPGRVVRVYDLGLQPQRTFPGNPPKGPAHEIHVTYELADEFLKNDAGEDLVDKPRWVSESFVLHPLSSDLATSTKRMKAIDVDDELDGDWTEALSRPIMINIVQNAKGDKVYENVQSLSPMRKKDADKLDPLVNEAKFFDLQAPDLELYNSLPKWLQEKIASNLEFAGSPLEKLLKGAPTKEAKAPVKQAAKPAPEAAEEESEDAPW